MRLSWPRTGVLQRNPGVSKTRSCYRSFYPGTFKGFLLRVSNNLENVVHVRLDDIEFTRTLATVSGFLFCAIYQGQETPQVTFVSRDPIDYQPMSDSRGLTKYQIMSTHSDNVT